MTTKLPRKISGMFLARDEHRFARLSPPYATPAHCQFQIMTARSISGRFRVVRTPYLQNLLFVEQREVRLVASVLQLVDGNEMEGGRINDISLARGRLRVGKDVAQAGITSLRAHLGALHLVCIVGHLDEEIFRNRFRECGQTDVAVELVD